MGVRIGTVSHSTQIEITYDLLVSFCSGTFHHLSFILLTSLTLMLNSIFRLLLWRRWESVKTSLYCLRTSQVKWNGVLLVLCDFGFLTWWRHFGSFLSALFFLLWGGGRNESTWKFLQNQFPTAAATLVIISGKIIFSFFPRHRFVFFAFRLILCFFFLVKMLRKRCRHNRASSSYIFKSSFFL